MQPHTNPHDRLFHFTFQHPQHAGPWLRSILPPAIAGAIDWGTLSPASNRTTGTGLRVHVPDLVFGVGLRPVPRRLLLVVEQKSWPDTSLHAQVLRYVVHLRRTAERRGEPLPLVIPVVLQHGGEVPSQNSIAEDLPADVRGELARLQPQLELLVDNLNGRSEQALRQTALTPLVQLTMLLLTHIPGRPPAEVLAAIERWGDLLRAIEASTDPPLGDDAVDAVGWYLLDATEVTQEDLQMAFSEQLNRPSTSIMSTGQRLRLEGEARGITKGISRGQAQTLQRLLVKRFGPLTEEILSKLQNASTADLDRWTDRLLDATSLDAMFAD
ncbi:MAG: Rpn family recombination-promoting nuclease/putative transposase [Planctomycetes bacterium]|jgi:hypothetical protein|nr:Rpn family recombination-promoting nuclease/putative transposase [Planctomycetota bacterium]